MPLSDRFDWTEENIEIIEPTDKRKADDDTPEETQDDE